MPLAVPLPDLAHTLGAVAETAGIREMRVCSTTPWVVCLVDTPLAPTRAETLSDEMSALAGCQVEVRPLAALPLAGRRAAWDGAVRLWPSMV